VSYGQINWKRNSTRRQHREYNKEPSQPRLTPGPVPSTWKRRPKTPKKKFKTNAKKSLPHGAGEKEATHNLASGAFVKAHGRGDCGTLSLRLKRT